MENTRPFHIQRNAEKSLDSILDQLEAWVRQYGTKETRHTLATLADDCNVALYGTANGEKANAQ